MSQIVVVDDDLGIRNLCYDAFRADGHEVIAVPRGEQIFDLLKRGEVIDLILMDVHIPGEEGLSLLDRVSELRAQKIPVVLFSGAVTKELEKEAYEKGAVDVIAKGIGIKELRTRINKILAIKHRLLHEEPDHSSLGKVLIVDDEEGIRALLKGFFIRKGLSVVVASSGEEALYFVEKEKPAIVLLDVSLPGMDGLMTLKKIREIDSGVIVVMATASHDESLIQEATELGAQAYVLKPFDLKYLELVVMSRLIVASTPHIS